MPDEMVDGLWSVRSCHFLRPFCGACVRSLQTARTIDGVTRGPLNSGANTVQWWVME
jgi:hypothetical protein